VKRAAFIDVDGTLTTGISSWERVHHHFNLQDKMKEHSKKFFAGEINYKQWALLDVGLWKGKSKAEIEEAVTPPSMIAGAKEGISLLRNFGYDIILVSGGINLMVDEVAKIVGADAAYSNIIGFTDDRVDGSVQVEVDVKSKVISKVVKEQGYDLASSIAVGDHINDLEMFQMLGKAFAVNPKTDDILPYAEKVIHADNFSEVATQILNHQ